MNPLGSSVWSFLGRENRIVLVIQKKKRNLSWSICLTITLLLGVMTVMSFILWFLSK